MAILAIAPIFELFCWLRQATYALANFKYKSGTTYSFEVISVAKAPKKEDKKAKKKK